ncbi:MAG: glycosyltransferase family 2 protein [Oleiphilus sp.]
MDKQTPKPVTIVISPRDRYTGLEQCITKVYEHTDASLFNLIVLNLGYPDSVMRLAQAALKGRNNASIVDYGFIIPIEAMEKIRHDIDTKYTVFLDNDSRVTAGWLPPIIETGDAKNAAVIYPVTLESSGVDEGADLRNHLFTTELRVVDVDNKPYLIEEKTYRRTLPDELPQEVTESQAFELHCVMFNTDVLKSLELPHMTIREHLDIGMQLKNRGLKLYVDPRSHIIFDNLGTRASLSDLKYFNLRWNSNITEQSSRLFEKRWGYNFYSEQSIYNWAIRRRLFLLLRWLHLPNAVANKVDRIFSALRRRVAPIWDPLDNPNEQSSLLYDRFDNQAPKQLDHSVK